MAKIIKNVDTVSHTYAGQVIAANSSYTISAIEQIRWANDDALISDISSGKAVVNDGTNDISGVSNQINFLKDIDMTPRDSDGSPLQRTKITSTGWHYQLHGIEFTTSKLDSIESKKNDGSSWNFTTMKFYKLVDGSEVEITGDDLNQTYLNTNCIKTVVDWEPNFNIDIIGGMLEQISSPTEDVRLWVVGVPDISAANGGSKEFVSNVNLKFVDSIMIDGKTPKYLAYNATYHTSKFRLIFRHTAGYQHKMNMLFQIFKV